MVRNPPGLFIFPNDLPQTVAAQTSEKAAVALIHIDPYAIGNKVQRMLVHF